MLGVPGEAWPKNLYDYSYFRIKNEYKIWIENIYDKKILTNKIKFIIR